MLGASLTPHRRPNQPYPGEQVRQLTGALADRVTAYPLTQVNGSVIWRRRWPSSATALNLPNASWPLATSRSTTCAGDARAGGPRRRPGPGPGAQRARQRPTG
ncbi:MAG: hypothetical protein M3O70_06215, partial [Actinomycetota bacterium]|nr:hypothetical protein [Actinomycetota bacterium]